MKTQQQVTLIVEGEEIEGKVRVRTRRQLDAKKIDRRETVRAMREEREFA